MLARLRTALLALGAIAVLAACSAPAPQRPAETAASGDHASQQPAETPTALPTPAAIPSTAPVSGPAPIASDTMPTPTPEPMPQPAPRRKSPEMSDPLPPEQLPEPVRLDRSCRTDGDCTVKNIGNCCGAFPSCVNVGSPTNAAAVQAQCAQSGMASVCGFPEVSGCQCVQGQCRDIVGADVVR